MFKICVGFIYMEFMNGQVFASLRCFELKLYVRKHTSVTKEDIFALAKVWEESYVEDC
jgi:hypothetical protein